ncbi:hypothetical protein COOONC_08195 [Cooperia oncophora]
MHERKSKIPLDVQLMMATGPVNNREVVYYPWSDQGAARAPPSQQMRVPATASGRERSNSEAERRCMPPGRTCARVRRHSQGVTISQEKK